MASCARARSSSSSIARDHNDETGALLAHYTERVPDELTKALLAEEVVEPKAIGEALFVSVTGGVPIVQALVEANAAPAEILARYLGRVAAPYLRQVVPVLDLVDRLPPGLCRRLAAIPVRRDAITGTIDVAVVDASDPHPANEISFHLGAPVRLVRASLGAIEETLRRLRMRANDGGVRISAAPHVRPGGDDERLYDSRPRSSSPGLGPRGTLPPPDPRLGIPGLSAEALRPSRAPVFAAPPVSGAPAPPAPGTRRDTPPWGTPIHTPLPHPQLASEPPPKSGLGSEIPIPLTRRAFGAVAGGTQRPPPLVDPSGSALGEGYPVDPASLRPVVEVARMPAMPRDGAAPLIVTAQAPSFNASFIPGPPPAAGPFIAYAPQLPPTDLTTIIAALRGAGSRDEVLELLLTGSRTLASRVALFVVKRGGYLGWACTPEFADRGTIQSVLVPLDSESVFDLAVREGVYLGPIRYDEAHAPLLQAMRSATRDVALVPVRVSGKTAVIIVADDLVDTMISTRGLEELARAAGEAFARIVRGRR
jgi:hypothetical protein